MVVWSIHVERTANKDKTSVCTKCLNTFRNTDNQEGQSELTGPAKL